MRAWFMIAAMFLGLMGKFFGERAGRTAPAPTVQEEGTLVTMDDPNPHPTPKP